LKKKTFKELKTSIKQAGKILKKKAKKKSKDPDVNAAIISNGWTESSR
jgi:hypothetical protein